MRCDSKRVRVDDCSVSELVDVEGLTSKQLIKTCKVQEQR